jgi:hypothetical protein
MAFWILTYFLFFIGCQEMHPVLVRVKNFLLQSKMLLDLRMASVRLSFLQEMLEAGQVPEAKDWESILAMPAPWGKIAYQSLQELRNSGAAVLPTLTRMRTTIEEQVELIQDCKVKSSQAFGQAIIGVVLIPTFALALYFLLPGLEAAQNEFLLLVLFVIFLGSLSFIWMISLMDQARFGNLPGEKRQWPVSVTASLERLMAMISTGLPPDLSWKKMYAELSVQDPSLAAHWKSQVWDSDSSSASPAALLSANSCERLVVSVGDEVRRSIQTSLVEGRGCLDRLESIHRSFLLDLKMKIGRELNLLPNRCLKPLFLCVFPAVFLLLLGGIGLSFQSFF